MNCESRLCPPVALGGQVCYTDGMKQKRAIFYIDGFNFYYLALKAKPQYKWLNPKALADGIVHDDTTVACVKYFSAPVSAKISQTAHKNQNVYLRALRTIPAIDIILGKFVVREKSVTLTPEEQHSLETMNRNIRGLRFLDGYFIFFAVFIHFSLANPVFIL